MNKKGLSLFALIAVIALAVIALVAVGILSFNKNVFSSPEGENLGITSSSCDGDDSCEINSAEIASLEGNGTAFVCADSDGRVFRSEVPCR